MTAPELFDLLVRRRADIEETLRAIADWMAVHHDRVVDPE